MKIVVALGGNAFPGRGEPPTQIGMLAAAEYA